MAEKQAHQFMTNESIADKHIDFMNLISSGLMWPSQPFMLRCLHGNPKTLWTSYAQNLSILFSARTMAHRVVLTLLIVQVLNLRFSFCNIWSSSMPPKPKLVTSNHLNSLNVCMTSIVCLTDMRDVGAGGTAESPLCWILAIFMNDVISGLPVAAAFIRHLEAIISAKIMRLGLWTENAIKFIKCRHRQLGFWSLQWL